MMRFSTGIVPALLLSMVTAAQAATYGSPILTAGGGANGGTLFCTITNVGKKPAEVSGTLIGFTGSPIAGAQNDCATDFNGVLPAGASCIIAISGGATARCTVETSGKIRAVLSVRDAVSNTTAAVPLTK